jgi:NAD(P)H-flavin reductase
VVRFGPKRRVDLFVGARIEDQLYDRADLDRLTRENPWLSVTYAVSDDKESALEHGDIGDVVERHGPWQSRDAYIAGPVAMVQDTQARLAASGLPRDRMRAEVFAPSRPGPNVEGDVTE